MASATPFRKSTCIFWIFFLSTSASSPFSYADEHSVVVSPPTTLQLSRGLSVKNSPGSKPGTTMVCERIYLHGLPRIKYLGKIANTITVKVSARNSTARLPNLEVCFHRLVSVSLNTGTKMRRRDLEWRNHLLYKNMSVGIGMCPHGQWEKVIKSPWSRSMSPFDHKLLDLRTTSLSLESFEVITEEAFFLYRIIFFTLGVTLMSLASSLSKSLLFYYGSAMAVGVLLVILMVLFQGMKLLPTGRKNSLAIFIYSSVLGLGTFLLRYIPGLVRTILLEIGINEDMYNPLAIFLLAFVVLAGAWLGFWVVRKFVLTEDGSIETSTSLFVSWSIRILAALLILQCSVDPLMATGALIFGIMISSVLRRILKFRFFRRQYKSMFKSPKKIHKRSHTPVKDFPDEYVPKFQSDEDSSFLRPRSRNFYLMTCNSLVQGLYPSTFHATPKRTFSKDEWEKFTEDSTEKALGELISSPDFSKWLSFQCQKNQHYAQKQYGSSTKKVAGLVLSRMEISLPILRSCCRKPEKWLPRDHVDGFYRKFTFTG